jgi:hypothetical protein
MEEQALSMAKKSYLPKRKSQFQAEIPTLAGLA